MEAEKIEKSQAPVAPDVPEIYKLINEQASVEKIAQQIYADFYAANKDPEKLYLGIDELQRRGLEGKATLAFLAQSTDELGALIKSIQQEGAQGEDLEKRLGITRFGKIVDRSRDMPDAHEYALSKGYTRDSLEKCIKNVIDTAHTKSVPHLVGTVKDELFVVSSTFGVDGPIYLELLGPREILRLRAQDEVNFLLLGSLGEYSAREFANYTRKISPKIRPIVIDKSDESINAIRKGGVDVDLIQADALALPFANESMDHIYTNNLFRFLGEINSHKTDIEEIFAEALRVLKRGGSIINIESPYGDLAEAYDLEKTQQEIRSIALRSGFEVNALKSGGLAIALRPEIDNVEIDSNGFPHYEHTLLMESGNAAPNMGGRFVKP